MHQLVGLRGRRYLLLLHLMQFFVFVAVSAFGLFMVLHAQGFISLSPWYASLVLTPAYGAFFVLLGMFWWALSGAAVRLDQDLFHVTIKRRIIPILLFVFCGTLISHLWLLLSRLGISAFGAGLELVPGGLAWALGSVALSRYVIRSSGRLRAARRSAPRSDQLVRDLKEEFGAGAVERIDLSHKVGSGRSPANPLSSPKGKVLYGLPSKPWYEASEFAWAQMLEENFSAIRDEAVGILGHREHTFQPYPYPGVSNGGWTSFSFFRDRKLNDENCAKCPRTAELLRELPRYPHFRDAMFSLLEPGREIRLHQDFTNLYLTCHLGLVVPPDSGLEVAGRTRRWEEGKCLIFDPSYAHAAWNHGSENRIVLLIDFLHPDINDAEYSWVRRTGT